MDSFIAGACAGLAVDLSLYPIDTVKTRLQSKRGFLASGGFHGVYRGLSAVAVGSVPGGAFFFVGYDVTKHKLTQLVGDGEVDSSKLTMERRAAVLSAAAAVGETSACCIRVPVEMVKQRMQAGIYTSPIAAVRDLAFTPREGGGKRFQPLSMFVGMPVTLSREIPFAVTQMLLYEKLKDWFGVNGSSGAGLSENNEELSEKPKPLINPAYYLPLCGAMAGGTAAFLTTPLDVAKTRIMLGESAHPKSILLTLLEIARGDNSMANHNPTTFGAVSRLFRGASTRVMWISIGGSVFFSTYEAMKRFLAVVPAVLPH